MTRGRRDHQKEDRKKTAQEVMRSINDTLGPGTITFGNDARHITSYIETGVLPLDILLDGGLPRGRITECFGDFSSLKSYIGLRAISSVQEDGGVAMLVDTEHSFDPEWAAACGCNVSNLIVQHPTTGEQAADAVQMGLSMGVDLCVWDSIAASQPAQEASVQLSGDKNIQPARLAALMSIALRRLNTTNKNTAILCINQTRTKVGVVFGSPETTPGGKALGFFASYRVRFVKAGKIRTTRKTYDGEKMVVAHYTTGQKIKCELVKSKLSVPEKEVYFVWDLVKGEVDEDSYLAAVAFEHGLYTSILEAKKHLGSTKVRSTIREAARNG
jgi:recombination protein RecA